MQPNPERFLDEVIATGHINVLSTHKTTLEITKEDFLTKRGDCIIGINSNKSVADYSLPLKEAIQSGKKISVYLECGDFSDNFTGYGHPELALTSPISMVFRKSDFISDRTALIQCSKSSKQVNRELISLLQHDSQQLKIFFYLAKE